MKWKRKKRQHIKIGTIKIIKRFLFLPKTLSTNGDLYGSDETRWLCFAKIRLKRQEHKAIKSKKTLCFDASYDYWYQEKWENNQ